MKKKKVEKLSQATETYEREVSNLQREIILLRRNLKKAENEGNKYKLSVIEFEEIKSKQDKKLSEIKAELNREISVRKSLEDAYTSSQKRLQEIESISTEERDKLSTLSISYSTLKQEILKTQYETSTEKQKRIITENTLESIKNERDNISKRYENTKKDMERLLSDFEKLKIDHSKVCEQLEKAQQDRAENSTRDSHLQEALKEAAAHNAKLIAECEDNAEKARYINKQSIQCVYNQLF